MFEDNSYPLKEKIRQVARSLNTSTRTIKGWFSYARQKKREETGVSFRREW